MTMFSAEKRQFCDGGGGGAYCVEGYGFCSIGSDLIVGMGEDELTRRTDGAESTSKMDDGPDEGWLQLSIGGHSNQDPTSTDDHPKLDKNESSPVELELMPSTSTNSHSQMRPILAPIPEFRAPRPVMNFASHPSFFLQQQSTSSTFPPHQINWAFRPIPISLGSSSQSQLYPGDFRIIQSPRRPHSGLWFMLQASQNQEIQPYLPQISKSYLRIKDGAMTIRLVIKYLVNKLKLDNESEIEITCKGQRLVPFLTLQHVRDNIWSSPRDFITLLPNSSTTPHIMVLHYARTPTN